VSARNRAVYGFRPLDRSGWPRYQYVAILVRSFSPEAIAWFYAEHSATKNSPKHILYLPNRLEALANDYGYTKKD
jgi:hypothetical protein